MFPASVADRPVKFSNPSSKKLLNATTECVEEALEALVYLNPNLALLQTDQESSAHRIVVRKDIEVIKGKVALISGGGAGHEPFSAGLVGQGLLAAAVSGPIFAAPPPNQIFATVKYLQQYEPSGILILVQNYTGDRLVFGMALERARSIGIAPVDMFISGEDCANTGARHAGKRGMAGNLMLWKIAGSLAQQGASVPEIKQKLEDLEKCVGSLGVCLNPGTVPGQTDVMFPLSSNEISFGLGIHGEAGVKTIPHTTSAGLVAEIVEYMADPENPCRLELPPGQRAVLLVNNLGSTSKLEELIFLRDAVKEIQKRGIEVVRAYCDHFMTSVDMSGLQLSILLIKDSGYLDHLDFPTNALAWPKNLYVQARALDIPLATLPSAIIEDKAEPQNCGPQIAEVQEKMLREIILTAAEVILENEDRINELDRGCGDGDCGSTLARGAEAIQSAINSLPVKHPQSLCLALSRIAEQSMGGCGSGIYSLFFLGAARAFEGADAVTGQVWMKALQEGIGRIKKYGGAEVGDRCILDSLCPTLAAWEGIQDNQDLVSLLKAIREAATAGAASTKGKPANVGRASYVSGTTLLINPDPGATAAAVWIQAVTRQIEKSTWK